MHSHGCGKHSEAVNQQGGAVDGCTAGSSTSEIPCFWIQLPVPILMLKSVSILKMKWNDMLRTCVFPERTIWSLLCLNPTLFNMYAKMQLCCTIPAYHTWKNGAKLHMLCNNFITQCRIQCAGFDVQKISSLIIMCRIWCSMSHKNFIHLILLMQDLVQNVYVMQAFHRYYRIRDFIWLCWMFHHWQLYW